MNTLWRLPAALLRCGLLSAFLVNTSLPASAQTDRLNDQVTRDPADAASCHANLNQIFEAIQDYRKKYKRLPDWLSDLHPEFIDDPKTFLCPFVRRIDDFQSWKAELRAEVWSDPSLLSISYSYEFCAGEYLFGAGRSTTVQVYKRRQMGLVGSDVPLVRCFAHNPVLNLSFGGLVFQSGTYWEENFSDVVAPEDLIAEKLFADRLMEVVNAPRSFPERSPDADRRLLDLTDRYNVSLTETWHPGHAGNNLANVPHGIVKLDRATVAFDVRGLVQLKGRKLLAPFPEKVEPIKVNQTCSQIHFLHGTGYGVEPETEIGHYVIQYADGQKRKIPLTYGKDVLDWWCDPKNPRPGTAQIAWEGVNDATKSQGKLIRLYHSEWENPRKDVEITAISFVSAMTDSAPFLIAITVD